jgi:hypothetical protein
MKYRGAEGMYKGYLVRFDEKIDFNVFTPAIYV